MNLAEYVDQKVKNRWMSSEASFTEKEEKFIQDNDLTDDKVFKLKLTCKEDGSIRCQARWSMKDASCGPHEYSKTFLDIEDKYSKLPDITGKTLRAIYVEYETELTSNKDVIAYIFEYSYINPSNKKIAQIDYRINMKDEITTFKYEWIGGYHE